MLKSVGFFWGDLQPLTVYGFKKLAISEHKTVCQHWTWYEEQSFI